MGKFNLLVDFAKAADLYIKAAKGTSTTAKSLKAALPKTLKELVDSRRGLYKLSPEEKVIDALKQVRTKGGQAKFPEEALRTEIKKVNLGHYRKFDPNGQYSDSKCCEIIQFAKRNDVNLKDVAEFSLLPPNTYGFVHNLPKDRFKIFKEFMRYTQSDQFYIRQLKEINPRRFSYEQLLNISKDMPEDKVQILRKLINIKRPEGPFVIKGEYVFHADDLMKIVNTGGLDINGLTRLARTSGLNGYSICEMSKVKDIDFNRASKVIDKIKKSHKGDVVFSVEKDLYEPDKFRLLEWSKANDKEVLIKTFDNKMNLLSTDKIVTVAGQKNQAKIIGKDFEVVVEPHCVPRKDFAPLKQKLCETVSETRSIRDAQGNLLRTEYLTPFEVSGLHNWKAVFPDGTAKPIIDVKKGKNGILTVTKDLEALDGTVTKSKYRKLPDGSWTMRLNISKNGKNLSKSNVKHKLISPNESESTVNGNKFKVFYSPDEIKVVNSKGETDCIIDLKALIDANNTPENSLKLKKMLKECSADELQVISKKLKKLEFNSNKIDAFATTSKGLVSTGDDIFIFRHEMGHIDDLFGTAPGKDMACRGIYSTADTFKNIYSQELNMFMKEFPETQRKYVDYFIDHTNHELSKQSFQETVAELIASNKCPDISKLFGTRTEYLERYFPQTRSFLVNT